MQKEAFWDKTMSSTDVLMRANLSTMKLQDDVRHN